MKKLSRIIMSIAICSLLSVPVHSMDEDIPRESKTSTASIVSRPSLWKTALVGLGMLASPASTQAQGITGFRGYYVGTVGSDMGDKLCNISISKITRTHPNHYHDYSTSEYKSFPMSIYTSDPAPALPGKSTSISISKIDVCSYPYDLQYIDNNGNQQQGYYTAALTYNPRGNNYDDIYLIISSYTGGRSSPNRADFEKVWDVLMTNGSCPPK